MKKRYAFFVSGVGLLALVTGIFMGKAVFSPTEEKAQPAQAQVSGREEGNGEGQEKKEGQEEQGNPQQKVSGTLTIYDVEDGYMQVPYLSGIAHHTYSWEKLHEKDGRTVYIGADGSLSKTGIDVSYFQEQIDWDKVKNAGIDFVMLRLGYRGYSQEGKLVVDEKFHSYIKAAQAAGLEAGVYFFSQAVNEKEAVEEADFVYEQCREYELAYPVVFDTEKIKEDTARTDGLKPEELTDITIAFCEKIEEYGYESMIYANAKWMTTKLQLERLEDYKVWYADYQKEPLYPYWFEMWQYTEEGQVDGIEGNVDLNLWFPQGGKK